MVTPSPQPMVMTIHPAPSAFDHFNNTPPTTPTPNVIKTIVPRSSPINSVNITTSYILIDTINGSLSNVVVFFHPFLFGDPWSSQGNGSNCLSILYFLS